VPLWLGARRAAVRRTRLTRLAAQMSAWRSGWVVSTFFLGGVLGAAASSRMNDMLGRRFALLFAGALTTASALLGALTTSYLRLLCVRLMFGFAMGVNKCAPGGWRRAQRAAASACKQLPPAASDQR